MSRKRLGAPKSGEGRPPFFLRLSTHLILVGLALIALFLARQDLPALSLERPGREVAEASPPAIEPTASARERAAPGPVTPLPTRLTTSLIRAAVPHTTISDRPRLALITYTVLAGDTVFGIAEAFDISPETILWSNGDLEYHPDDIRMGQPLTILPVSGIYYQVKAKDTLQSLARTFKVEPSAIVGYELNEIGPDQALREGQKLVIPGGEKPYVPHYVRHYGGPIPEGAAKGSGSFVWPASGYITQGYWTLHRAIDIGGGIGTPVLASDSGYVVYAGWDDTGYGNLIIVAHGNDYYTYYAHLNKTAVSVGDSVARGKRIGSVGSTGRSTGSHLHFEIRHREVQRNPLGFLP
jgi:murein DD-endopeptidase MepM/ murein hydrolase activator NlpD